MVKIEFFFNREKAFSNGFTMLEVGIILLVLGFIITVAIFSWLSLMESREIAKTKATLLVVKRCLLKKMAISLEYPTYSSNLNCTTNYDPAKDVDSCICDSSIKDAWDNKIRFLEGFDTTSTSLQGKMAIDRPPAEINGTSASDSSIVIDKKGDTIRNVVFVLISFGKDKQPDHTSYGNLFVSGSLVGSLTNGTPRFDSIADDICLILTDHEVKALLKDK